MNRSLVRSGFFRLSLLITLAFALASGTFVQDAAAKGSRNAEIVSLSFPFVPDSLVTTGSLCTTADPDFSGNRYKENIAYCSRSVDSKLKKEIYDAYGVPKNCRKDYTIDHFVPLSMGGTNQKNNLWPEARSIKALRQNLELEVFEALRDGQISQAEAIEKIQDAKLNPPVKDPAAFTFCH